MPDKNLTDKEIVKALEDLVKCNNNEIDCGSCSLSVFYPRCPEEIGELSLDLINRLQAQVKKCEKVEHFADKTIATLQAENKRLKAPTTDWLVKGISKEQLQEEKIQAFTEEINRLQAEKQDLEIELKAMRGAANGFKAEIERLMPFRTQVEVSKKIEKEIKSEAIKEFAEKAKEFMHNKFKALDEYEFEYITERDIDNLIKEIIGE